MLSSTLSATLFAALALAAPAKNKAIKTTTTYPFNRMVAFGDNLSDNGNGSYAWCIADRNNCNNAIYGHNTWTNGPVAVSYLTDLLSIPLTNNFAIGHADGGSNFGSTIDNNYTLSPAKVPSAVQQITNYTSHPTWSNGIAKTLHFLWTGNNDIEWAHTDPNAGDYTTFANQYSALMVGAVKSLQAAGAKYIIVPNIYPKHVAPIMTWWTDAPPSPQRGNIGHAIQQANNATQAALAKLGGNVMYYDVFGFMMNMWNNPSSYNFTHVGGEFCDGYSQNDWNLCMVEGYGYEFFWINYLDPTTAVHKFIAQDMAKAVKAHTWT